MAKQDDLFECSNFVSQAYPDDIHEWPEVLRNTAYAARDRLLKRDPGVTVIAERSYCIDNSHERWPDMAPHLRHLTHALMYEVTLDRPIEEETDAEAI